MCLRIKTFLNFKNPFSFVLKVNLFYKTLHRVHLNHTVSLNLSLRCVYQTRWTWWNIYHNLHKYSVHTLRNTAVCNKILQSYILHALFNSDILMMIYFENSLLLIKENALCTWNDVPFVLKIELFWELNCISQNMRVCGTISRCWKMSR